MSRRITVRRGRGGAPAPAPAPGPGDIVIEGTPDDTVAWLAVWAAVHEGRVTRRFLLSACPPGARDAPQVVDRALAWLAARDALRRGLLGWVPGPDALAALGGLSEKVHGGAPVGAPAGGTARAPAGRS